MKNEKAERQGRTFFFFFYPSLVVFHGAKRRVRRTATALLHAPSTEEQMNEKE
jgi:hypothetical protein